MTANASHLALRALCDELARCGLTDACTSPGSRNSPIVLALAREPRIRCWSHVDERCAGFFAVGAAKASGRPVAVTCTSGTAAANLAPAVIEAFHARVPLIVLTADRPPELRDVGAGQTIDQLKLYGDAVKWFVELGVPEASPEQLRWIRGFACRAYWTAAEGDRPGPVHINVPLREPLIPDGPLPADPLPGRPDGRPWRQRRFATRSPLLTGSLPPAARAVVVAGQGAPGRELAEAAARAGVPLLADPLSGARHGETAIAHYDLLLRDPELLRLPPPDLVLRSGDLPTSKPLRAWLASLQGADQVALDARAAAHDPDASLTAVAPGGSPGGSDDGWLEGWLAADDTAAAAVSSELEGGGLSEPWVAAELGRVLNQNTTLVVASSMPIRDVEAFFPARVPLVRVLANRGANGIDGTVSTAFGVAAATGGPVVLLIGDVALLHDIGGLLAAQRLGLALAIVLLHNDGGGIFHFLPVAGETDAFEAHVATPHGIDFAAAAALYGLEHQLLADRADLRSGLERALANPRATLLESRTDRRENLALHRRLAGAVGAALSRSAPAASPRA